ncbi:MAG: hypothetical protein U0521_18840 [Anaerolineae bacterium]
MDELRKPLFVIALVLMLIVVLIEIGSGFALRGQPPGDTSTLMSTISGALPPELQDVIGDVDSGDVKSLSDASGDIPASPSRTWRCSTGWCCSRWRWSARGWCWTAAFSRACRAAARSSCRSS